MASYRPPEWMKPPSVQTSLLSSNCEWKLDEIKGGIVVASHVLKTPLITFGRVPPSSPMKESSAIVTAHESCSRLHARIAFDAQGTPWLRDLQSGNGTKVNKKPLPPKSIGKLENMAGEGGRGVIVYPGDIIQFGASTRVYVLEGPREFERGARKAIQQQALLLGHNANIKNEASTLRAIDNSKDDDENDTETSGISWGISMDEHVHEPEESSSRNEELSFDQLPDPSDIPKKHRKVYDKIRAKEYKLSNMQVEMQRIQSKASTVELSDGQIKQLESLQGREKTMLEEISQLKHSISDSTDTRTKSNSVKKREWEDDDDVDDFDFYDRTNSNKRSKSETHAAETDKSLISRCKSVFEQLKRERVIFEKLQFERNEIQENLRRTEELDEDYFFLKNDLKIANDEVHAKQLSLISMNEEIDDVEKLLKIADEQVIVDRKLMFVGNKDDYNSLISPANEKHDILSMMPPPRINATPKLNDAIHKSMPPPSFVVAKGKVLPQPMRSASRSNLENNENGDREEERDSSTSTSTSPSSVPGIMLPPQRQARGPMLPPQGMLSFMSQSRKVSREKESKGGDSVNNDEQPKSKPADSTFDSKIDEWVAPQGQDGSGMTKLNKKFGNRY